MADKPKPNLQQAIAEIGNMQRVFRAFGEADNALAVLSNMDTVRGELEKANAAAKAELGKASADVEAAKGEAKALRDEAAAVRATATKDATKTVADAAEKERKATESVKAIQSAHDERMVELMAQEETLRASVEKLTARLAELGPAVERAERIAAAVV